MEFWEYLNSVLETSACGCLEEVVHELTHAYLCIGSDAFNRVGNQQEVNDLISGKFKSQKAKALHEVKTSAITYLLLEHHPEEVAAVVNNMLGNINLLQFPASKAEDQFENYITNDQDVKQIVSEISNFLTTEEAIWCEAYGDNEHETQS